MQFACHQHQPDHAWLLAALRALDEALHPLFRRALAEPPRRILVLRQDRLGDVAASLDFFRSLRRRAPEAQIHVLAREPGAGLLRACGAVDEVIAAGEWIGAGEGRGLARRAAAAAVALVGALTGPQARALRAARYDVVIDCVGRRRNLLLALAIGARHRIGFDFPGGSLALHQRIRLRYGVPYAEQLARLLDPLGVDPEAGDSPVRRPTDATAIGLHLGHGGAPAKKWQAAHWVALARLLGRCGRPLRVLVGPGEAPLAEELSAAAGADRPDWEIVQISDLAGLVDALGCLAVLVCIDSGPMHVADELGVPLVAIFNGSDPLLWGPRRSTSRVVRALEGGVCHFKARCQTALCINAVTAQDVADEVEVLLSIGSRGGLPQSG